MKSTKQEIEKILGQMTLDEKLAQLGSYWFYLLQKKGLLDYERVQQKLQHGIGQITRIGGASTYDPLLTAKTGNEIQKFLLEKTRLGIPAILHEESCAGAMILGGTMFPQMIGLASTFRPELASEMTAIIKKQLLAVGARQALAPVLDVCRDPRWGRTEETFGEDPTLVSNFGVAYIQGLQGKNLAEGVAATGKHFIGHSVSQGGMNCNPVHMGMGDVYDVFLGPFQAAIRDAGLASMMNAYPDLDGEVVAASRRILTDLLRNVLGFDGPVVSDYEAVLMLHTFHWAASSLKDAAVMALEAGIDVELPETVCYGDPLKAALESGELNLEFLDTAVRRHLKLKFDLGLFENPFIDETSVFTEFDTQTQRQLAREIANQSMVLLKNEGALPLNSTVRTLAVIGPNADNGRNQLGDYSYAATLDLMKQMAPEGSCFINVDDEKIAASSVKIITVLDGIKNVAPQSVKVLYAKGCDNLTENQDGFDEALLIAKQADAIVLVLGDCSGLVPECTTGEFRDTANLGLPGVQQALFDAVIPLGKPIILVLINGRPYAIPTVVEQVNAVLEAWLPGEEGGQAVADVLFGKVNPGGKLPITIPRSVGQLPLFYNQKQSGNKSHMYIDYVSLPVSPLFPFGHGLSYTTFAYSDLKISASQVSANNTVKINCQVTNTGLVAGDEIVQLYIRDEYASLPRPKKELKGYHRVKLAPGESQKLSFNLSVNQLAFYTVQKELIVEAGNIQVMVGSSSEDIRLTGEFEIIGEKQIAIQDRVFVCPVESERIKR